MAAKAGLYLATITKTGFEATAKTGTEYLQVDFEVSAIKEDGEWVLLENPLRRNLRLWFSEKTYRTTLKALAKIGWTGTDLGDLEEGSLDHIEFEVVNKGLNKGGFEEWEVPGSGSRPIESNPKVAKKVRDKFNKFLQAPPAAKAVKGASKGPRVATRKPGESVRPKPPVVEGPVPYDDEEIDDDEIADPSF